MPDLFVYLTIVILAVALATLAWLVGVALGEIDRINERLEP